jgi:abelson tyrosine-protein kinase 1
MRAALQTSNDVQMIEVLQVGREEMPEAIKTLQRALEREVEKEGISASGSSGSSRWVGGSMVTVSPGVAGKGVGKEALVVVDGRRASVPVVVGGAVHELSGLERRKTVASTADSRESGAGTAESLTASGSGTGSEGRVRDTLDREFIESGIDALRRVSNGPDMSLPSWTITK